MTDWIDILGSSPGSESPLGPMDMMKTPNMVCLVESPVGPGFLSDPCVKVLMPNIKPRRSVQGTSMALKWSSLQDYVAEKGPAWPRMCVESEIL